MPIVEHRPLASLDRIRAEGQEVLDLKRAQKQDIRELHIGLLNMMPDAALAATERQFLRLIGNCNQIAQFWVYVFTIPGIRRSAEAQSYIDANYEDRAELMRQGLDGLIITGTNPQQDDFCKEPFWPYMQEILEWSQEHVSSVLCSCLASHAAFEYFYGVKRHRMPRKLWGIYPHQVMERRHPLMTNINTRFDMPHSRWHDVSEREMRDCGLRILVRSPEAGVALATSADGFRQIYLQGHPEYDTHSILKEFQRDMKLFTHSEARRFLQLPKNYFNDAALAILFEMQANQNWQGDIEERLIMQLDNTWRDTAKAIFNNWLGLIYQLTHFERDKLFMDGVDPHNPLGLL